jgi:hypothetical protein
MEPYRDPTRPESNDLSWLRAQESRASLEEWQARREADVVRDARRFKPVSLALAVFLVLAMYLAYGVVERQRHGRGPDATRGAEPQAPARSAPVQDAPRRAPDRGPASGDRTTDRGRGR